MLGKRRRSSEGRTEDSPSKRTKYDEGFEIYERFEEVISKPELFLSPKQSLQEQLLNLLQQIYSFGLYFSFLSLKCFDQALLMFIQL